MFLFKKELKVNPQKQDNFNIYFVYQNETFKYESFGNYIWAPIDNRQDHTRLLVLQRGDIILHSVKRKVTAFSIVEKEAANSMFPGLEKLKQNDELSSIRYKYTSMGRVVKTKYFKLPTPIPSELVANEIIQYGQDYDQPFNGTWGKEYGKMGYLFCLHNKIYEAYRKVSNYHNEKVLQKFDEYLDFVRYNKKIKQIEPQNDIQDKTEEVVEEEKIAGLNSVISIAYISEEKTSHDIIDVTASKSKANNNVIYVKEDSPLMQNLIGKKIKDTVIFRLDNNKERLIKILDIKN